MLKHFAALVHRGVCPRPRKGVRFTLTLGVLATKYAYSAAG
jgi:hypothetical protein